MSSGFVSGGTIDEPTERDDEWLRAQRELEEERRQKAELGKQDGGKSLYEILQQNKMAKQEAFEESMRLKNQFRSLDEDEVEFLDAVLESTRAQEAAVKRETEEQLAEFHRQREEADRTLLEETTSTDKAPLSGTSSGPVAEDDQWAISGRKRKRSKKDLLFASKGRRPSATEEANSPNRKVSSDEAAKTADSAKKTASSSARQPSKSNPSSPVGLNTLSALKQGVKVEPQGAKKPPDRQEISVRKTEPPSLGLVSYSSDEE